MALITEQRFVELIEQIPVMQEKLDRILFALGKIAENDNLFGINTEEEEIYFDEALYTKHSAMHTEANEKEKLAQELQRDADAIKRELGL